ncbi:M48 family metallopeptidase [Agaribacterium haliotis]|uniref:M48 family metallopeptidase n=1 Tax=Agaribacterium haliotis TaxID=2013869 RepID=UPI00130413A3|nr:SprT family zinc-dependent metalloprotease [Agaribacterium haliotis]
MKTHSKNRLRLAEFELELSRKRVKNINLRIDRAGTIKISAPAQVSDTELLNFAASKLAWIRHHRQRLLQAEPEQEGSNFSVDGLLLLGKKLPLKIKCASRYSLSCNGQQFILHSPDQIGALVQQRCELALKRFYKRELEKVVAQLSPQWQKKIGVEAKCFTYRSMKSKWGSCNIKQQKITLNSELMRWPAQCIEYVLVHELVHLLERYHNRRFYGLMDKFLPDWRISEQRLKQAALERGQPEQGPATEEN